MKRQWWWFWHVYRWRVLAAIFGSINHSIERFHDRWHQTKKEWCEMCKLRENDYEW